MIHKYTQTGLNIVLDVNSGAVHVLDRLAYRILDFLRPPLGRQPPASLKTALEKEYPAADIAEAYAELYTLFEEGQLFAEDAYDSLADKLGPSPVKALCLNISHDCNLRCAYCFAGKGVYSGGRALMSEETGKKAIDYLISHSGGRKSLEVDFFGGEPLLNFDVIRAVVAYAKERGKETGKYFRFTVTTNGLLLDDEKTEYLNCEMNNIVLSLDGRRDVNDRVRVHADGTGCYDDIVPKFQKLVAGRKGEYYLRGTFTGYNKDFAEDVLALYALGFDQISVEPVVADPSRPYALRGEDLPDIFAEYERMAGILLKERKSGGGLNFFHFMIDLAQGPCAIKRLRGCGCGNEYLAVTPEGDVYPCHQFTGQEAWKMGSIYGGTLDINKKAYFARCTVYQKPDCRECWAKFYCSGGCGANNYIYEGDVCKAHTLSCEMEKKRLECAIAIKAAQMIKEDAT